MSSTLRSRTRARTMPPLQRGAMTPQPWRNGSLEPYPDVNQRARFQHACDQVGSQRRAMLLLFTCLLGGLGVYGVAPLFSHAHGDTIYLLQLSMFMVLFLWIAMGFITASMGAWVMIHGDPHALSSKNLGHAPLVTRTAVVMTICNENLSTVFAGMRSTIQSVQQSSNAPAFDFFVLSDTPSGPHAEQELVEFDTLRKTLPDGIGVYYRRRLHRTKKKAGNVADFCRRWGRKYAYMVVLDADSIMTGECLEKLVRLMDRHPSAGIIQTVPKTCGHTTLHARVEQFTSRLVGKLFTLGMQYWQLGESHYWGHNAIIRIQPFMAHCGLAAIGGSGALSGAILSHDFVEAALMRRAGYRVWLVEDLDGSYEQQPPNMLAELERDRRWCRGNLQNLQLLTQPGLHPAHRAMLLTGAMSYLAAPLWLAFFVLGYYSWYSTGNSVAASVHATTPALWVLTLVLLLGPRAMGVFAVLATNAEHRYGGTYTLLKSTCAETLMAFFKAPIKMVGHSFFVFSILSGQSLEWKSPPREASYLDWMATWSVFQNVSLASLTFVLVAMFAIPSALPWCAMVAIPLILATPFVVLTGDAHRGLTAKQRGWLRTPEEFRVPRVIRQANAFARA